MTYRARRLSTPAGRPGGRGGSRVRSMMRSGPARTRVLHVSHVRLQGLLGGGAPVCMPGQRIYPSRAELDLRHAGLLRLSAVGRDPVSSHCSCAVAVRRRRERFTHASWSRRCGGRCDSSGSGTAGATSFSSFGCRCCRRSASARLLPCWHWPWRSAWKHRERTWILFLRGCPRRGAPSSSSGRCSSGSSPRAAGGRHCAVRTRDAPLLASVLPVGGVGVSAHSSGIRTRCNCCSIMSS